MYMYIMYMYRAWRVTFWPCDCDRDSDYMQDKHIEPKLKTAYYLLLVVLLVTSYYI